MTALDGDTNGRFARRGDFQFQATYADPFFLDKDDLGMNLTAGALRQGSFVVDGALQRTFNTGISLNKRINNNWSLQTGLAGSHNTMSNFGTAARDTLVTAIQQQEGKSSAVAGVEADAIRSDELADGMYFDFTPSLVYRNIDSTGTGWRNTVFGGPSLGIGDLGSYFSAGFDVRRYDRLTDKGMFFRNASRLEALMGGNVGLQGCK